MLKKKIYFGWIIVICGTIIMSLSTGIILNTYGLFIIPVCEDLGFTRAQMNFSQTLHSVGSMIISFSAGFLFTKCKLHNLMKLASIGIGLFPILYSFADRLPVIFALCLLMSVSNALLAFLPFTIILSNWFHKKTGLAIGIAFMGSGLGGMIFNNVVASMLETSGWRTTMLVVGILCLVVIAPIVFFVLKITPEEKGLRPYGEAEEQKTEAAEYGMGFKKALRSPRFVMVMIGLVLSGFFCNVLACTYTPFLQDIGYSISESALIYSGYMGVLVAGKIGIGALTDKIGAPRTLFICMIAMLAGITAVLNATLLPMALLSILTMGIFETMTNVMVPMITRAAFGTKDLSAINGLTYAANYVGASVGPTIFGLIYEAQGSYAPGYKLLFVMAAVCMTLLIVATRKTKETAQNA